MKGTLIIYYPGDPPERKITEYPAPIPLPDLQAAVGGYIEIVPHFDTIELAGKLHRCVVFCDEDGKRKRLPRNHHADRLWSEALITAGKADSPAPDFLVGPIAVVTGDDEFMAEL